MPSRTFFLHILLVGVILALLSACAGQIQKPEATRTITAPAVPLTSTPSASPVPTLVTPTPGATASGRATVTATPVQKEQSGQGILPSGWTIFSNPDFVKGLVVQDRTLWAATLGGVVAWNLDTHQPIVYTTRDGLADIQGNDVAYCSPPDNRIYVAHAEGILSVYDISLAKWSRVPITFADGSTFKGVETLFCDTANHRLLAGSPEGLGILDLKSGTWRHIGAQQGLKVNTIRAIGIVGQTIWIAAEDESAFMIMGNTVFPFDSASGFPSGRVNDLSVAPDSSIWFGYSTGLVHYHDKKWNSYGAHAPFGIPFQSVDRVVVGPDKRIWIASAEEGVCPYDSVTLACSSVFTVNHGTPITDIAVDADGVAYAGTDGGGILVIKDDQVSYLAFDRKQLMSNDVMDITGSADGHVWVATDRGVNIFDPARAADPWQAITPQANQLVYPGVSGLLPAANGMWLFYNQQPLANLLSDDKWLQLDSSKGISDPVLTAALDLRGYVWFATAQGIKVWDGSIMRVYSLPGDIPPGSVRSFLAAEDGMWVGTGNGLLRFQRFQWTHVIPDLAVNTIFPDSNGGLLLGTDQGLVRFDGSQSYTWILNLGTEIVQSPRVTSIARDGTGRLWVGTDGQGVFHYDGKVWERFDTASGLPTDHIRKIFTDHLGTIWIAAVTGEGGGSLVRFIP